MTVARTRVTTVLVALATLLLAWPGSAMADSFVYAEVTQDGARVVETNYQLIELEDAPIDQQNIAWAYARCSDCQAYAVSFQIVLAENPGAVTPYNDARAVNDNCTRCETGAWAQQWVRGGSGEPELSDLGEDRLEDVERQVRRLERGDLTLAQFEAEVSRLEAIVEDVLANELTWEDDDEDESSDEDERSYDQDDDDRDDD